MFAASKTAAVSSAANYIEECFSTFLYTGNDTTQTITNGIDLSGEGGLVWIKDRTSAANHYLFDTERGATSRIFSNLTNAASTSSSTAYFQSFNNNGFTVGYANSDAASNYASWSFAKAPKFFDVVTYTGNGTLGRTVSHNLGSVPGCIIVKNTSNGTVNWAVYHRSVGNTGALYLNTTNATDTWNAYWNDTTPTNTSFTLGNSTETNANGATYVAYLFAHDAGGFGLTGTDNVISCGSVTTDGSGNGSVTLGYEPQWLLVKRTDDTSQWYLADNMRGMPVSGDGARLFANLSNAESTSASWFRPNATGFTIDSGMFASAVNLIYIAIRRGPMKVPTSGTSVYNGIARTGNGTVTTISNSGFTPDMVMSAPRTAGTSYGLAFPFDRLRGALKLLETRSTGAEQTGTGTLTGFDTMNGYIVGTDAASYGAINTNSVTYINWNFRRAPSFFDEVCYTGNDTAPMNVPHNLGVTPQLMIIKKRSGAEDWNVFNTVISDAYGGTGRLFLNKTDAYASTGWAAPIATSTAITLDTGYFNNQSGSTYVAYLFATCAGVSKVGSYTGTGTTKQVDCGFTGGARFVLIKRTDSTGDWYVWDSARGIVAGNDPYLLLNSTAAEVTNTDYVDTYSAGFEITSTAPAAINASGGTFIFLAIA